MCRGFMFFLIVFAGLAIPGEIFAIQGNMPLARTLIHAAMIPGAIAVLCQLAVYLGDWQKFRNRPRILC